MNGQKNEDTRFILLMLAIVLSVLGIPFVYKAYAGTVNGFLLSVAQWELRPFVSFFSEAMERWQELRELSPEMLTWADMVSILTYAGQWVRLPILVILAGLLIAALFMGKTQKFTRSFSMESLLANNAESFACLCPIVGKGKYLLSKESFDTGPWRLARSPIQFALEHGLLSASPGGLLTQNKLLRDGLGYSDMEAFGQANFLGDTAETVFKEQLGRTFTSIDVLSSLRRPLAIAFLAYADGDKKGAISLLDAMSRSYSEGKEGPSCPVLEEKRFLQLCSDLLEKHRALLEDALLTRHNAFELPWFMALLTLARKKGILASSQFLFVRPLDRPLWYALNQCGGRTGWAEALASWAHYAAEEKAGKALSEPQVQVAVSSLRAALDAQGWLVNTTKNDSVTTDVPDNDVGELREVSPAEATPEQTAKKSPQAEDCSSKDFMLFQRIGMDVLCGKVGPYAK